MDKNIDSNMDNNIHSNTKWIWIKGESSENTWMNFVKTVYLDHVPQTAMAKITVDYMAGIKPLESAYQTFEIKPHMGGLHFITCTVPSMKGDISLAIREGGGQVTMRVVIPKNTTAEVYLPLVDHKPPKASDYEYTLTDGYAKFVLQEGTYHLSSDETPM